MKKERKVYIFLVKKDAPIVGRTSFEYVLWT